MEGIVEVIAMRIASGKVAMRGVQTVLFASLAFFAPAGGLPGQQGTQERQTVVLWPQGAPGAMGSEDLDQPQR